MSKDLKTTAIVYDFDGTLARGNIQEGSFIPTIANMDRAEFWSECKRLTKEHNADEVLVYMHLMLETARKCDKPVMKDDLKWHGQSAQLFPGLADRSWFRRINDFAGEQGLKLDHYIVSSGIEEMIRGCPIADEFAEVFASKFVYDENGQACWAANAINYTVKTQYLFRINKGIKNVWDNQAVNEWIPLQERAVPFERMIFIGDGDTDIPSMKMTTGGRLSIGVADDGTVLGLGQDYLSLGDGSLFTGRRQRPEMSSKTTKKFRGDRPIRGFPEGFVAAEMRDDDKYGKPRPCSASGEFT